MVRFLLLCLLLLISQHSNAQGNSAQCSYQFTTSGTLTNVKCGPNAPMTTDAFVQNLLCQAFPTDPMCKPAAPVVVQAPQPVQQVCSTTTPEFCPKTNPVVETAPTPPPVVSSPTPVPVPVPLTQQMNNPLNPVSPISPLAPKMSTAPVPQTNDPPSPPMTTTSTPTTAAAPAQAPKTGALGKVMSLDVLNKPALTQPNVFPAQDLKSEIPLAILIQDKTVMDILQTEPITQQPLKEELDFTQ